LACMLSNRAEDDVLFIDDIHRLNPVVEEYLYSAMEDYQRDIVIDSGPSARSIQIELNRFTLVGATTRKGLLTAPLRARFGIDMRDRKSTRLNSSHVSISYAVFCLKKKITKRESRLH